MFTGIIEGLGEIKFIEKDRSNLILGVKCDFVEELKIDQSISHNGACLTVFKIDEGLFFVALIAETVNKTNFGSINLGDFVNLERCLRLSDRLDGHFVTGHVDLVGECVNIEDQNGSWKYTFMYQNSEYVTVEKGSITINGVSLTVVDSAANSFSVCIIPYTYQFTNFNKLEVGSKVNLEFDVLGKYVAKLINNKQ
jgi:riboflavin synthase